MDIRKSSIKVARLPKKILFLCAFVFAIIFLFFTAGRFLALSQTPKNADVIIVLSGGYNRVETASDLFKKDYASFVVLSNVNGFAGSLGDMLTTALSLEIPSDVILSENDAKSTYENAKLTLPILKDNNFSSAIVVSSDFHMRRVKFNFDRVYKNSGIEITYIGVESGYNSKSWWSNKYSRETTFDEYVKLAGNILGYNGPDAKKVLYQIKNWFR
ncbi:hypothetical protein BSK54_22055 [Paenibacillus odorifer]|uniref:YdcF family protein n=1 Tax=Paenibacillus odorifer TaxID=189426 RepID=UPI00096DE630|nr:YdcF family protein [Paenibacillus odorifer]OMD98688.1 hypothetical protein BSK54_22055 [Paenibacillus odorifer]